MGKIVAVDQGTTSSRAILFDTELKELSQSNYPLRISCPNDGWVEQDGNALLETQLSCIKDVLKGVSDSEIDAIGITNQRETILCWEKETGKILAPAIVWQCRRSASIINRLNAESQSIKDKTGLVLDPYFSASKIVWMMENIPEVAPLVKGGKALFGTVDTFLVWKLSEGKSYITDPTNASRTMLFNINTLDWDDTLLKLFNVPRHALPTIVDSSGLDIEFNINGKKLRLKAVAGDQQASLYGHKCFTKGQAKCTFGTGAFLLLNTGEDLIRSTSNLISTVAWKLKCQAPVYAVEGSVFIAGSLIQWLRDQLKLISSSEEIESLARKAPSSAGVTFVPALTGLGAPHWNSEARGLIYGLTRDTSSSHIARAALEGVAHMVCDLLECSEFKNIDSLSVDGGMSKNALFLDILAGLSGIPILRSKYSESTALGIALMALGSLRDTGKAFERTPITLTKDYRDPNTQKNLRDEWKKVLSAFFR